MKPGVWLLACALYAQQHDLSRVVPPLEESGFQSMFDGKTLSGWDCDSDFWRVEDGAIVGESKLDHQGYPADIDLKQVYTGQIYEERGRGFLALRGQISSVSNGKKAAGSVRSATRRS